MTPGGAAAPRPVTGTAHELRRGTARALIGEVAAVLRAFAVDGVDYTEPLPDDQLPPMGAGIVLMPWPNRVAGGRWCHAGESQQLDVTEVARGNAIHGLLRNTAYRVADAAADRLTLAATVYPQHGWPFTLDTAVTYGLTDSGLAVTHRVVNAGAHPAVFGCGAHPYLRVGDTPTGELTLTLRAQTRFVTDERLIPVRAEPLAGAAAALPTGAPLATLDLDDGFGGIVPNPATGRVEHALTAPDGRGVMLWADPVFAYAQVFTPRDYPSATGSRHAVAVEPMTCPADALNSGTGLITLAPGELWRASWGLTPFG